MVAVVVCGGCGASVVGFVDTACGVCVRGNYGHLFTHQVYKEGECVVTLSK